MVYAGPGTFTMNRRSDGFESKSIPVPAGCILILRDFPWAIDGTRFFYYIQTCVDMFWYTSTSALDASVYQWTLPRRENSPQDCFLIRLSSPSISRTNNKGEAEASPFFGARDGTRTHTAVATRTSNVLVYHSNTLASA